MIPTSRRLALSALLCAALLASAAYSQTQPAPTPVPYTRQARPEILKLKPAPNSPKGVDDFKAIQARVEAVVKEALPATVALVITQAGQREEGSGIIVSRDGYVLTAGHVSGKPGTRMRVVLSNGTVVDAISLGADTQTDSGMVKITTPANYPFVPLGISKLDTGLSTGQWVIALGHPAGYQADRPPVVRIGRVLRLSNDRSRGGAPYIQTDCELIMGDSGGPLFDLDGRLIGINSRIGLQAESNVHVPIDSYTDNWDRLARSEQWSSAGGFIFGGRGRTPSTAPASAAVASIGASRPDEVSSGLKLPRVRAGFAAEKAGLKEGDIITKIDGQIVKTVEQLTDFLSHHKPGDIVAVDFVRNDIVAQAKLTLDASAANGSSQSQSQRFKITETKSSQEVESAFAAGGPGTSRSPLAGNKSTARIFVQDRSIPRHQVALGTIVSADGYILTKRSEIVAWPKILVSIAGRDREAKIVGTSLPLDLALLKIDAQGLTPVTFADTRPPAELPTPDPVPANPAIGFGRGRGGRGGGGAGAGTPVRVLLPTVAEPLAPPPGAIPVIVGQWVATANAGASAGSDLPPKYVGVISVARRLISDPIRDTFSNLAVPFIGISYGAAPEPDNAVGVVVVDTVEESGAALSGLKAGDIITAFDGWPVHKRTEITNSLWGYNIGDTVALTVLRGNDTLILRVVLGLRPEIRAQFPDVLGDPDFQLLSGMVSKRSRNFPAVFQHDTLLEPTDCGGPLVDIDGHVIGINIARAGRTEAYALPADIVVPAIEALKVNRLSHLFGSPSTSPANK